MNERTDLPNLPRRRLLGAGAAALSAAGLAALAGTAAPALARKGRGDAAQDAALLNAAVALEHEGIAAVRQHESVRSPLRSAGRVEPL